MRENAPKGSGYDILMVLVEKKSFELKGPPKAFKGPTHLMMMLKCGKREKQPSEKVLLNSLKGQGRPFDTHYALLMKVFCDLPKSTHSCIVTRGVFNVSFCSENTKNFACMNGHGFQPLILYTIIHRYLISVYFAYFVNRL